MGILVIGSGSLLRAGLVSLLATIGFDSIQEADGLEGSKGLASAKLFPNMMIVCLARGVPDIVGVVDEVRAWGPAARIVLVAPLLDLQVMSGCFAAGASGFLLESITREALGQSLKLIEAGEKVFPSELASLFPMLASKQAPCDIANSTLAESHLSPREIDIARCLIDGQSNKLIAKNLDIAEATVKVHVKRILRKANVANRTQAALWGVASGLELAPATRGSQIRGGSSNSLTQTTPLGLASSPDLRR